MGYQHTIHRQVPQRSRRRPLHLDVMAFQEIENGFQSRAVDRTYICHGPVSHCGGNEGSDTHTSLSNLSKSQTGAPLKIHVLTVDERAE